MPFLDDEQLSAVNHLRNGCILCGGVGSGKSRTALAYYVKSNGGGVSKEKVTPMLKRPQDLYIITTARKRDTGEWELEFPLFEMLPGYSRYEHKIVIDSWNNLHKYVDVRHAFFIFDEQRVVGKGAWAKAFQKIARFNNWILLSATPGDRWEDYRQVFIANGFYRNATDFNTQHLVFNPRVKFPKIERYENTRKLLRLRNMILVDIKTPRETVQHHEKIFTQFDKAAYQTALKTRWNARRNRPMWNASELCQELRRIVNTDPSRSQAVLDIFAKRPYLIIFYNFDYELELLKGLPWGEDVEIAEWNGHQHQPVPLSAKWVYLVQYSAGSEGWNCVDTDTMIFFSQSYSYRTMIQASGRIDRRNTSYKDLWYYHMTSKSSIELSIERALSQKKTFNETKFCGAFFERSSAS
jgi:hypothetical protein